MGAATEIETQFGPIDVCINVAFTSVFAPVAQITPDEFRRVAEVSYLGYVNGTMVALSPSRCAPSSCTNPQPVLPIYQPEVAAHGVLYAANHPRRKQYWVGGSTAATLLAQKFAPAILDRYRCGPPITRRPRAGSQLTPRWSAGY